ncbi:hypothetical protein O6H91_05G075200 [Diphasiastrum complanatum]|uniref:Uncharacterized protein n=1 Tax=Diphasiastrum complanatum TaxID=34168 RepID=A0ACC2DPK7_DIPCM|nr:hypothetical protein O6H91_05G075200 [Diphasiastrum complanatum]
MKRRGSSKHSSFRVVWDEQNLELLEANKTPKQKITESKTPFYAAEDSGMVSPPYEIISSINSATHADAVRSALSEVASSSRVHTHNVPDFTYPKNQVAEMDEDGEREVENGHLNFEDHRRTHYDEFQKAKHLCSNSLNDNEEDENEDEEMRPASCSRFLDAQKSLVGRMNDMELQDSKALLRR